MSKPRNVILADQLRTGLGVAGAGDGCEERRYLYGEFRGCEYLSGRPSVTTLLFTRQALTAAILHLMRGGVTVFGASWARMMSDAFVDSVTGPATVDDARHGDLPTGLYL